MSAPHILLANIFFAPFTYGGATVVAEQVARALIRNHGCRVSVVSLTSRSDLEPYTTLKTEKDGIVNYLINMPEGRQYAEVYNNQVISDEVARLIDLLAPDLMHLHCIQELGAGILRVAKDKGLPLILSVHDFWWICDRQFMVKVDQTYCGQNPVRIEACQGCVENYKTAQTRFRFLQEQGALADVVTYPSRFARDLCEASGFAPGKGVVWENGVEMPEPGFFDAQAARRTADPRLTFGFVGGPSDIKGWPVIRKAFAEMERRDFRVLLVEGSLDGNWWKGKTPKGLPGDWQLYPRFSQNEMDAFYAQVDVLLFMSQWKETFGLAIREALARGIRVIQTDSGGTTEHGTVPQEDLIPIGAGPEALRPQLEAALANHPATLSPHKVASFNDQAAAFMVLVDQLSGTDRS